MLNYDEKSVGIIYDQSELINPLFQSLSFREISYEKIEPENFEFPGLGFNPAFRLLYNDMSVSGYQFRSETAIRSTIEYLKAFELQQGLLATSRIINGSQATELLYSKSRQLSLFSAHQLPIPKSVVTTAQNLPGVVNEFRFPILIKDVFNHADSTFIRIENQKELVDRIIDNTLVNDDRTLVLVQEEIQLKANSIIRVDTINGDIVKTSQLKLAQHPDYDRSFVVQTEKTSIHESLSERLEQLVRSAQLDVGTLEFGIDRRTNQVVFLGIQPITIQYETSDSDGMLLSDLAARYIERRLNKVREIELAI